MFLPPAQYAFVGTGAWVSSLIVSGRCILLGFSARETTGTTAAALSIKDGSSSAVEVFNVTLNPSESTREWFGPMGIALEQGLFVQRTALQSAVTVFFVPETWVDEAGGFAYPDRVG